MPEVLTLSKPTNLMSKHDAMWFRTMLNTPDCDHLPLALTVAYDAAKVALDRIAGGSRFTPQEMVLIALHAGCLVQLPKELTEAEMEAATAPNGKKK